MVCHKVYHIHITRRRHRVIVATGIVTCGLISVTWPDLNHLSTVGGTAINLLWLLAEPTA